MKFPRLSTPAVNLLTACISYEQNACCTPTTGHAARTARVLERHGLLRKCDCTEGRNCYVVTDDGAAWNAQHLGHLR